MRASALVMLSALTLAAFGNPGLALGSKGLHGVPPGSAVALPTKLRAGAKAFLAVFPIPSKFCRGDRPAKVIQPDDGSFDEVIKARFNYPQVCMRHMLLADAWAKAHPTLQVVIADGRSSPDRVKRMVAQLGVDPALVALGAPARKLAATLKLNRSPFAFLIDSSGVVRDKIGGFGLERWLSFDEQVRRAARGDWAAIDAHRMHEPVAGKAVEYWPPGAVRGREYTLVISEYVGCEPCAALAKELRSSKTAAWLQRHPGLSVNVFIEADDRSSACRAIKAWKVRWGGDWLPYPACPPVSAFSKPRDLLFPKNETLPEGLHIVVYLPAGPNDVGRWWGMHSTPSATFIRGETVLAGPQDGLFPSGWIVGEPFDFSDFFAKITALMEK